MDLSSPISSVIPSGHGVVLAVLARTTQPLSGRQVASLANGRISQSRVSEVLRELCDAGIVLSEEHPPARSYVLNRKHVAASPIVALAGLRAEILDRMIDEVAAWSIPPVRVALFGSFARGEGGDRSDIDVLVVRRARTGVEDPTWTEQLVSLAANVEAWSGNACSILEYTDAELRELADAGDPIVASIRADGIDLSGRMIPRRSRDVV